MFTTITSYHNNIRRAYNPDSAEHWDPLAWVWCHPAVHSLSDQHTLADVLPRDLRASARSEPGIQQGRIQALTATIHRKPTAIPAICN